MLKKNPFKNKFVVNFHHADFDGAISGSCVKAALGENSISKAYAIAKVGKAVIEIINDTDLVLLTDIGVYGEDLEYLIPYMKNDTLIIYDHHLNKQSKEAFSHFSDQTLSVLDSEICGSTLTWCNLTQHLPNNQKLKDLEQIVYLSDVYDMWRIENPDFEYAAKINDLLDYKIGYNPDQFRERFFENPDPYKLSADEEMTIKRKKLKHNKNLKIMARSAALFDYKEHVVVMVEAQATDYTKMHFMNEVLESEQIDMFIFKYPRGTQSSVRIPNGSKIDDLNDWYDDFGCVGHAKAGGISTEEYPKLKAVLDKI
jgi:oligoribonuclease NrnB/cAMP/cGMP phosphodiesterase (DHH superfamily)